MARKQVRTRPDPNQELPAEPESEMEADSGNSPDKPISKSAAARAAISEGFDSPSEAVAFIRSRYGIDMTAQHFSAVKSQLKKSQQDARSGGRKSSIDMVVASREGGLLDVLEGVKQLVDQYGADSVKRMVDLLGKSR